MAGVEFEPGCSDDDCVLFLFQHKWFITYITYAGGGDQVFQVKAKWGDRRKRYINEEGEPKYCFLKFKEIT